MNNLLLRAIIVIWLLPFGLAAQPILELGSTQESVGQHISYYADATHKLTIEDIAALDADRFTTGKQAVLNFGLAESTYWLRLQIKNPKPSDEAWLLELAYPLLDSILFYQQQVNGTWQVTVDGEVVVNKDRTVEYRHFLFPITQSDTEVQTYYLRIQTESAARFPLFIRQNTQFFERVIAEEIIFGLFYGAMLVMVLYNLFLFFALRDQGYLLYCAFIFLNTCAQATFSGHIQQLGIRLDYANTLLLLSMFGAAFFAVVFAIVFLKIKRFSGVLYRMLIVSASVAALCTVLSPIVPYKIGAVTASFMFLITPLLVWLSALVAWRKGNTSARYFTIAWTMYLVAVTLISLRTLGIIPGSMPLETWMQLGSVLDAVLLSLALADRINSYRRERIRAQAEALKAAQEKEQLVREQNTRLEERVMERTEEISAQNEELQVQQEMIAGLNKKLVDQNEGLEEEVHQRNRALAQSNRQLVVQNKRLEQFASVTSHNLRGPVANILGLANIFDRRNLSAFNDQCLGHLQQATQSLDAVVQDMNHILSYNNGSQPDSTMVSLESVLDRVKLELAEAIRQESVQVTCDFSEAQQVLCVRAYAEHTLISLLDNAIKFRSPSPPAIHVSTERADGEVVVAISDNGLGIDTEKYGDKLFKLYQRFHTHRPGRGVGLYIVKTQMEAMGGYVTVRSQPKEGTTFRLHFKHGDVSPEQSVSTEKKPLKYE